MTLLAPTAWARGKADPLLAALNASVRETPQQKRAVEYLRQHGLHILGIYVARGHSFRVECATIYTADKIKTALFTALPLTDHGWSPNQTAVTRIGASHWKISRCEVFV